MKKLSVFILGVFWLKVVALAQPDSTLSLKGLEIPSAPAFVLLDEAPSSIERPASTKAFTMSLLNATNNGTELPKNYAVEFTPFWFFKHPGMTALKYIGLGSANSCRNVFTNIQKSSLSVAFIQKPGTDSTPLAHHISLGARCNLISVWSKKDEKDIRQRYNAAVSDLNELGKKVTPSPPTGIDSIDKRVNEEQIERTKKLLNSYESQKPALAKGLIKRPVFAVDVALGYHEFVLDNDFDNRHFGRLGAWMTCNYAYNINNSADCYLNVYAVGKYLKDGTQLVDSKYVQKEFFDAGLKIEFECKRLCLSYEWLKRVNKDENTTRSNAAIKYRISENLYLTGAYGKNFGMDNNLISLLGISWGISTGEEKVLLQ